jgi:hypothetical protein
MIKLQQIKQTHWAYWASGTLLSLATLGAAPLDLPQYGALGIVTLLFSFGTLFNEREQMRPTSNA